ncbi:UDP-glucose 4-epimerase GalE [Prochlorococcus sp. AH-716-O13]|nr:UDP-glucose 4-epimerase GalE [Prochlorococcus sp. AH-716-O13]
MTKVLLTGGFGYIGSHIASLLALNKQDFIIYDNFSNCKKNIIERLNKLTGKKIKFVCGDIRDTNNLVKTIQDNRVSSVIHLAALKSVGESTQRPIKYYDINVCGTISLLNAMETSGVKNLLFSSSATIYGEPKYLPINEKHPLEATNPYGETKLIVERILKDVVISDKDWSITSLRYFNPIGAHISGLIGDDPSISKNQNIIPSIMKVIVGSKDYFEIFGNDYDTKDGTGVRDYIHIMDLADAHISALNHLLTNKGLNIFNLGTGNGFSVMEVINTFEKIINKEIPKVIIQKRKGDVSTCYADPKLAKEILNWKSKFNLMDMCLSSWNFSKSNK